MRETVRTTFEARRGVGERSKKEIRGWGAIVSGYTSENWPPADWSLSPEDRRIVVKNLDALKDLAEAE
jgi:hypothetical protein